MKSSLPKFEYPFDDMKLKNIYYNENYNVVENVVSHENILKVYDRPLGFEKLPEDRPLIYSSLVLSLDGKIAFNDAPEGPFIAKKNFMDQDGATVDWWTLNILRASSDGIMFGANTLSAEPDSTGHVYDQDLEDERIEKGLNAVPFNIIPTLDGLDIPFDHIEFTCGEVPIIIYTNPLALDNITQNIGREYQVLYAESVSKMSLEKNIIYILVSDDGTGKMDNVVGMSALKRMGINRLLVESPTLLHLLTQDHLVDELFFNVSCVYLGGNSLSIGQSMNAYTSDIHPHTEMISIYMHSPSFFYCRHKLIYNKESNE